MHTGRERAIVGVAVLAGLSLAPVAHSDITTWTWDIGQSLEPCTETCFFHFSLVGPPEPGYVIETRVEARFTTFGEYDASEFYLDLMGPIVQPDQSIGAQWIATGADLGWSGQGTFFGALTTDALNGEMIVPGFWSLHVGDFGHLIQGDIQTLEYVLTISDEPPVQPVPGDLDGDGVVDTEDFLALLAAWGPCPDPPAECPADLDGNGEVDTVDFLTLLANWG